MQKDFKQFDQRDFLNELSLSENDIDNILNSGRQMKEEDLKNFFFLSEVSSKEKVGKTRWALSSCYLSLKSKPIREQPRYSDLKTLLENGYIVEGSPVFAFDTEQKVKKLQNVFLGQDIKYWEIWDPDPQRAATLDVVKMIKTMITTILAIQSRYKGGTILIDSGTDVNEMFRKYIQIRKSEKLGDVSELGVIQDLMPAEYGVRNDLWSYFVGLLQKGRQHVVFTSREEETWGMVDTPYSKDNKKHLGYTGVYAPKHWKDLPYFMDVLLKMRMDVNDQGIMVRKSLLDSFSFDEKIPLKLEWENANYVEVIGDLCKYSHKKILSKLNNGTINKSKKDEKNEQNDKKSSETTS